MGSKVTFKFDKNWERKLLPEMERNAKHHYQSRFDRVSRTHAGRPKAAIRAALKRELNLDKDPDPSWVDAIHEGRRIVLDFK